LIPLPPFSCTETLSPPPLGLLRYFLTDLDRASTSLRSPPHFKLSFFPLFFRSSFPMRNPSFQFEPSKPSLPFLLRCCCSSSGPRTFSSLSFFEMGMSLAASPFIESSSSFCDKFPSPICRFHFSVATSFFLLTWVFSLFLWQDYFFT